MTRDKRAGRALGPFPPLTAAFTGKAWRCLCYLAAGTVIGAVALVLLLVLSAAAATVVMLPLLPASLQAVRQLGRVQVSLTRRLCGADVVAPAATRTRPGARGWAASVANDLDGWRALGFLLVKVPVALAGVVAVAAWLAALGMLLYPAWLPEWRGSGARDAGLQFGDRVLSTWPEALTVCAAGAVAMIVLVWAVVGVASADRRLTCALLGGQARDRDRGDATMDQCRRH